MLTTSSSRCLAILQGHTSLVGQLQMKLNTLVTGGSDGSVRVWSLETLSPIHRLAAHDNSVTSLQFNESRIISGGSDGRVKVWDLKTGTLVRELSQPAEAVWRVVFEEEKAVVMASRNQRTIMEVWNFAPPEEELEGFGSGRSNSSSPMRMPSDFQDGSPSPAHTRSLLTSAFHPPPQPAPPHAPTILPIEGFPSLTRQHSHHLTSTPSATSSAAPQYQHNRYSQSQQSQQPHQPQPQYPIPPHMHLLPDDDEAASTHSQQGAMDVDIVMADIAAAATPGPSGDADTSVSGAETATDNDGIEELHHHLERHLSHSSSWYDANAAAASVSSASDSRGYATSPA